MDTSGSELQELRRLVGELTARVFRIERALNLPRGSCGRSAAAPGIPGSAPPAAELKPAPPAMPIIPPRPACSLIRKAEQRRPGIPHRFALAEPDRHHRRADRRFLLPEICLRQ